MLFQSNDPLFSLLRCFTCQKEVFTDFRSLKDYLKSIRALSGLLINFNNLEVIQGVELPGIIISLLLCVEIYDTSIGNNAELFGPLVSLKHPLSAFPEETHTGTLNIHVLHDLIDKWNVIFD